MILKTLIILLCSALILSFCNIQTSPPPNKIRIKEERCRDRIIKYFYYPDGRVSEIARTWLDTVFFRYHDSVIISSEKVYDYHKLHLRTDSMIMGNKGWVVRSFIKDGPNKGRDSFEYNEAGCQIPHSESGSPCCDSDSYVFNKDGSLAIEYQYSKRRRVGATYFYYYDDKPNTLDFENTGQLYLGSHSKHPMKEMMILGKADTLRYHYNYRFDDQGRIICEYQYGAPTYIDTHPIIPDTASRLLDTISYTYY